MSDEVSQFLEQVERLRGQQMEDDEVRARELEEFLAAKRERQARREDTAGNSARLAKSRRLTSIERARSISPQKSSPVNTPSPGPHRRSTHFSEHAKLDSPTATPEKAFDFAAEPGPMTVSNSSTKENEAPLDSAEAKRCAVAAPLARSSPLPWQRRPDSRSGGRPLSIVAAQNATQRSLASTHEPSSATEQVFSIDHSVQPMASKDPSFVGQTADRGVGSAACRRSQAEDDDRPDMSSFEVQLPGMRTEAPSQRPLSLSGAVSPTKSRLGSPVSLRPRPAEPWGDDMASVDQAPSTPSGRTSPLRSASPTKGMGGFVQSAMMKRSDSVKRWSVTSPPGLTRADSVAASRSVHDRPSSQAGSRPQSLIHAGSPMVALSRPTSKHEEEPDKGAAPRPACGGDLTVDTDGASKRDDDAALPSSPTKTMDPRRWSPTKSSWLESALNKPDSPKLPPKPTQSQPAWMVELNKARADRANSVGTEANRQASVTHKHQVSIGGLMRQSPVGEASKPNPTGLGGIYSPPPATGRSVLGHQPKPSGGEKEMTIAGDKNATLPDKRQPSVANLTPTKAKPDTPPSRDFRASLRQRSVTQDDNKPEEPEFRNVFGNLRRTKTQNFVATDELKDNILRGKAALNVKDGPRKGERKDEFKEALLKKREDFVKAQAQGKGVARGSISPINRTEKSLPEGLARRIDADQATGGTKEHTTRASASYEPQKPGPEPESRQPPSGPQPTTSPSPRSGSRQGPAATDEAHAAAKAEQNGETEASPKARRLDAGSGGGGKLAGRFNPALAGMLARGPPLMATNSDPGSDGSGPEQSSRIGAAAEPTGPGPQLMHMTKNRARGPRRKAPTGSRAVPVTSRAQAPASALEAEPVASREAQGVSAASVPSGQDEDEVASEEPTGEGEMEAESEKLLRLSMQKHVSASAAFGRHSKESSTKVEGPVSLTKATDTGIGEVPQPGSPKKLDKKRISRFLDDAPVSNAQARSPKEPSGLAHSRAGSRSPTKQLVEQPLPGPPTSPGESDRDALPSLKGPALRSSRPGSPLKSPSCMRGGPYGGGGATEAASPRQNARGRVRPLSGVSGDATMSPVRSPTRQASDVSTLLADFFGPPCPRQDARIDTAEMLANRPATGAKTTNLGVQMFQMLGDGTKKPVSAQNERVLFEQEMYVCAHNFINAAGRRLFEVYFWVGDEVAEAAAEEAKLSVQREARSLGGTLVRLRQGQETAEFLQALGGVMLVRRGSSNKYDSLAPSMLCGRRYRGQVAFDEVDFAPSSLCAGFSYLIAQSGRCVLWKGRGSDVAEVSCARLVGMDLTLTGELVEHDDGSEPASFWTMFGADCARPQLADHWRLKPQYDKYSARLFCSDADARPPVYELHPFGQADLSPARIYILDAFFEMYIVVGTQAKAQYVSFRNALDFAQEYAILAAGIEDRPFVPVSSVVLEGIPRDLKRVFRKWDDARCPTLTSQPAADQHGLRRGRSLRVVTLTQALQALSDA